METKMYKKKKHHHTDCCLHSITLVCSSDVPDSPIWGVGLTLQHYKGPGKTRSEEFGLSDLQYFVSSDQIYFGDNWRFICATCCLIGWSEPDQLEMQAVAET